MKILLILFLVGICAIGLQSPEIMHAVGIASSAQDPASLSLKAGETDWSKLLAVDSPQIGERGEWDKLLNLLARGKYE
jgi:hypothetical protein